jgi:hypothetical protein
MVGDNLKDTNPLWSDLGRKLYTSPAIGASFHVLMWFCRLRGTGTIKVMQVF